MRCHTHLQSVTDMSMGAFPGGLEIWDRRRSGKPQLRSPISWGITGSGTLDAAQVRALLQHGLPPSCTCSVQAAVCKTAGIEPSAEAA